MVLTVVVILLEVVVGCCSCGWMRLVRRHGLWMIVFVNALLLLLKIAIKNGSFGSGKSLFETSKRGVLVAVIVAVGVLEVFALG